MFGIAGHRPRRTRSGRKRVANWQLRRAGPCQAAWLLGKQSSTCHRLWRGRSCTYGMIGTAARRLRHLSRSQTLVDNLKHQARSSTVPSEEGLVGQSYSVTKVFEPEEIGLFLDTCGDSNPLHIDFEAAEEAGFPGIILPGLLCASLFPGLIGSAFPGAIYASQTLKFIRPALATEPVRAVVHIESVKRSRLSFTTQLLTVPDGVLLVDGTATAVLRRQTPSSGKMSHDT